MRISAPNIRSQEFADEAHRQATLIGEASATTDDQEYVEVISAPWDE